jgi:glyoxylase-like metal-dependent hydrolase (beta-lactamase superfamily II)
MFTIKRITCNQLQENCYIVSDETSECVIIDCGAYFSKERAAVVNYIRENGFTPRHLLATHGHFDHNFGNETLYAEFQLQPEVCEEDAHLLDDMAGQTLQFFGVEAASRQQPPIGRILHHNDIITFGSHTLRVLHTPGHSHGSCLFWCEAEQTVFTGDTLFRMSIGRTDFDEGNWQEMEHSLVAVVAQLPPQTTVLSGHGLQTTIADELQYNPYLMQH